jgi:amino acid adenylation domain-containing protein
VPEDLRPLSFPQERVWFLHRLADASVPYQFQMALRLRGRLDVPALERALTEVVRRHETLRTTFHGEDGVPGQRVHPPFCVALSPRHVEDEAEAWTLVREAVAVRIDPERLPLIRWRLLRLAPEDHLLVQVEHHLVHDGWSLAVLLREVVGLYTAFARGQASPLPELERQFADYAAWQRVRLRGDVLEAHLAYWRDRLRDVPPPLDLPLDRPRPPHQTFRGDLHRSLLPAELYAALKERCRREGVTLYVLLLAAFDVLLRRLTGQDDIVVASGFANRERPESEPLIGMLVNTLPIRVDLGGDPSFRDLLARVRAAALGAHEHQETPFEAIVAAVAPDRDLGVNALHQVLFSFHDSPVPDLELPGLSGQLIELHNGTAKADLNVIVMPRPEQRAGRSGATPDAERVQVWWEYASDLFDEATVAGLARRYLTLLRGVVARPDAPIAELPLLTPEEQVWDPSGEPGATAPQPPARPAAPVAPRPLTPVEALVAEVWSDVLGIPVTAPGTDFFAAGGHSLSVGRVVARLARRGRTAPMRLLFEHPTLAAFAEALDREEPASEPPAPAAPEPAGELLPVSSAQQRLWLVDQMHPGLPAYNICRAIALDGPLDAGALDRALTDLVARHEALRTTFRAAEGEPQQRIAAPAPLTSVAVPVGGAEEARERAAAAAARPFDLARGPLFRAELLALGRERHWLLLTLHHVIADGWTVGRLLRDLEVLYGAHAAGVAPELPPAAPYRDYAHWQREWLASAEAAAQLAWWRTQVAGLVPIDLPTDRPRPAVPERHGGLLVFTVPPELLPALRGATPFHTLLAAFFVLLHRMTGQRDLAVGVPVSNRPRPEWEDTAGFFVNSLVIRARVDGDPTFRLLADQVRRAVLDGLDHQAMPFDWLVEALRPERLVSHNPLFDVSFGLLDAPGGDPAWPGLTTRVERFYGGRAKLDLNVELAKRGDEIEGTLEYDRDLFDGTTAEALRDRYLALLQAVAADPDARVGSLPLLAPRERAKLASLGAGREVAGYPRDASIHALFADVVARVPGRVAVVAGESSLNYAELDRRSEAVAGWLAAAGLRPGDFAGIEGGRSLDLVVAILAVLKAGGAYVPLDESNPPERLRRIYGDTRMRLVLDTRALPAGGEPAPPDTAGPLDAAYVMFTSGSTGEPKGVVVPHRAVVRLARGRAFAAMGHEERWLHLAPDAFDASTLELWAPLLNGGTVVMAPAGHVSLGEIGELVRRHRVTSLWLTAGLFHAMVDENVEGLRGLRRVLAGGDTLSAEHVRRALGVVPEVINGYGPTENTTFTAVHVMRSAIGVGSPVPIGQPIEGTTAHLVDERGELVPPGAVGELVTGGDGVSLGYLGRPGATAERFVPDPFGPPGARLYRTGDFARWRPDGALEFAGRRDGQVKVRGHRVELGEVEAALVAHERVRQAVVVLERTVAGEERLVGYVVGEAEPAGLEEHLRRRLPEPMVPRAWVCLAELPLGPTGKVDRRALPALPSAGAAAGGPPLTATEELVAGLFGELLGAARAGRDANFFALGGHSLLATRLVARLRDRAGANLPLGAVFDAPTVGELAAAVAAARSGRPVLRPTGRRTRVPLSFAQERLWFLHRYRPDSAVYDIPLAIELTGPLDRDALASALQVVVDRHPALRTVYGEEGGRPFQTILDEGVSVELGEREASGPFDLGRAPLLRASLTKLRPDRHRLLLVVPHIAADGASLPVLVRELSGAYGGTLPPAPALTYADYALWQRQVLGGPQAEALAAYWREALGGAPGLLALPTDVPRPERPSVAGAAHRVRLPAELVAAARRLGAGHGATLYATLLTAFQALLHRATGETDLVVGAPFAGRDDPALEELVGLFVNTLPVRGDLGGDPTFREVLERTRTAVQRALAHAELPFERIVEAVRPERSASHEPLVQALFQLQPAPPGPFPLGEAEARLMPSRHEVARLDLTVSLFEAGDDVTGFWEYRTDLFEEATIARLARRFEELLRAAVADPDLPLVDLPLGAIAPARRRRAPAPAPAVPAPELPVTGLERALAGMWEELLGVAVVRRDSDFFALGGHSIVALRLVARVREALGREVPLSALFEHPTVAGFAQQVASAPLAGARPPLTRRVTGDEAPLSFAQERHWVLHRLEPDSPAHNVPLVFRLGGPLDVPALERALTAVAARQDGLRTIFAADGSRQRLLPPAPVRLRTLAAEADLEPETRAPFALDAAPPWRAALLRRSPDEHLLALTLHHVIADGWSMSVLLEDLRAAYEGGALEPLPVQYADYAVWQREWLQGEALDRALAYWRHLEGVPVLRLPTDRPRAAVRRFRGGSLPLRLPPATRSALAGVASGEGATLFMAALTAFVATLHRHTGQADFAVGTFSANRDEVAVERLVGFFVNNLALRCNVSGDPTWRDLLRRVRDVTGGAFAHQEVPFERVLDTLKVERALSHAPLFQAMCVLQSFPAWPDRMGDLALELVRRPSERADYDVTLWLHDAPDGWLNGGLEYDRDLFDEPTIAALAATFLALAGALAADPDGRVAAAGRGPVRPAITPEEGSGAWAHERVAAQAARTPDAVALTWLDEASGLPGHRTYGEMWARVEGLARRLRTLGVGPEVRVGVLVERSPEAVAGFLAVLTAGGAYVPVDPEYPPDRVAMLLEDARAGCLLTTRRHAPAAGVPVVLLDEPGDAPPAPPAATSGDQLAYVIHTSGSTGRPKGVMVTHASLRAYLDAIRPALALAADDRVLNFASVSFDAITEEVYPALLAGASVVLRPSWLRTPDAEFEVFLAATAPTVLSLPVTFWHAWVDRLERVPVGVRMLLLNAEAPSVARYRRWVEAGGAGRRWINTYGPTEATVTASLYEPNGSGPLEDVWGRFPIGTPLPNTVTHVLDAAGWPVPDGTPGELHLGGAGVTRGYVGQPGVTAAAYVPDPFSVRPGARMYRTGDVVRRLPGGELDYLGRLDAQVKIRGHRVELGEVEAALDADPAVRGLAVVVDESGGERRLVAYVAQDDPGDVEAVRSRLRALLPPYMVPARFLRLPSLPLTPNGKVDRRALAARLASDLAAPEPAAGAPPGNAAEAALLAIWEDVLGRRGIGVHDNFFALGGDSIMAMRLVARAREEAGLPVEPRDLFRHQTIAELAAVAPAARPAPAALASLDVPEAQIDALLDKLGGRD